MVILYMIWWGVASEKYVNTDQNIFSTDMVRNMIKICGKNQLNPKNIVRFYKIKMHCYSNHPTVPKLSQPGLKIKTMFQNLWNFFLL